MMRPLALLAFAVAASPAAAHYHMLLPDAPSAKVGDKVTFTYQFGHPFEHELSDAARPEQVFVVNAKGEKTEIDRDSVKRVELKAGDKSPDTYRFSFTPKERGDHHVVVVSPKIKIDGKEFVDTTRVVIHVQTQNGWDAKFAAGKKELRPLTRPYGLRVGSTFSGEVQGTTDVGGDVAYKNVPVEAEPYNAVPPKEVPPDEHITQAVKTDKAGAFAITLHTPGWWAVTAVLKEERFTLWIYVDDKIPLKPADKE